jgi:tetratricopeptide (TPR) repeat protein
MENERSGQESKGEAQLQSAFESINEKDYQGALDELSYINEEDLDFLQKARLYSAMAICAKEVGRADIASNNAEAFQNLLGREHDSTAIEHVDSIIRNLGGDPESTDPEELSREEVLHGEGRNFLESGEYKKALEYFFILLKLEKNPHSKVRNLEYIGKCYEGMDEINMALFYYSQALEIPLEPYGKKLIDEIYEKTRQKMREKIQKLGKISETQ